MPTTSNLTPLNYLPNILLYKYTMVLIYKSAFQRFLSQHLLFYILIFIPLLLFYVKIDGCNQFPGTKYTNTASLIEIFGKL